MIALQWNNLSFDGLRDANDIVIGALHYKSLGPQSSLFPDSSAVERSTVNRNVVGSNPTRGAIFFPIILPLKKQADENFQHEIRWTSGPCATDSSIK